MIYDIVSFFYELDLLEIRMEILDSVVDKFVIVEATESFIGEQKPLYFKNNIDRFSRWKDKIIHYVVDDFPNNREIYDIAIKSPNVGNGEHWWVREFYQKESIKNTLIGLNDDDICIVSDVDEIWNPKIDLCVESDEILRPVLLSYMYYLNYRSSADKYMWTGPIITRYENIKNGVLNHIRSRNMTRYREITNGGWHFEALGGALEKIRIVKHPDYFNQTNLNNDIMNRIETLRDYKGRDLTFWKDETDLNEQIIGMKTTKGRFFI